MIIIDFQQVMVSNIMAQTKGSAPLEVDLVRHMVLNSLRSIKQKFYEEYGDLVIAYDTGFSWRKDYFPYYKANRKKSRDESATDWQMFFNFFNELKEDFKEILPYKVISVDKCEADDIIGTVCLNTFSECILIVSGDKDFIQLHNDDIKQYNPVLKKFVTSNMNTDDYLFEHILKGDKGDGIPNVLSSDASLIEGKRQKTLRQSRINSWNEDQHDEYENRNFWRNKTLIDLSHTPSNLQSQILEELYKPHIKSIKPLYDYMRKYKLTKMIESIGDF